MPGTIELLENLDLLSAPQQALMQGRTYLTQSESEAVAATEFIDLAVKGDSLASALTFINLEINGQISNASLKVFEGGSITGGVVPTTIRTNRALPPVNPNHTIWGGIPATPLVGTLGTEITPPNGLVLIGEAGVGGNDKVDSNIDIGGFVCAPDTWYVLRVTNESASAGDLQLSLTFIDPSG